MTFQMTLPVTRVPEKRSRIVSGLMRISEVGLFQWMAKQWLPVAKVTSKEDPKFLSVSIKQVNDIWSI